MLWRLPQKHTMKKTPSIILCMHDVKRCLLCFPKMLLAILLIRNPGNFVKKRKKS